MRMACESARINANHPVESVNFKLTNAELLFTMATGSGQERLLQYGLIAVEFANASAYYFSSLPRIWGEEAEQEFMSIL